MKRIIVLSLICGSFFSSAYCQLQVENNGNVAVKYSGNSTINSYFSINSSGDTETCATISSQEENRDVLLNLTKSDDITTNNNYAMGLSSIVIQNNASARISYGTYSRARKINNIDSNVGRSYGVYAYAGNSTSGWNYGIFGTLYGNNNGAGVFGSSQHFDDGMNTSGKYAGFFHGDVKSTDAIYATAFNVISDYRFKENIEPVSSENIDNIMKLNVVKYNLKPQYVDSGDTATTQKSYYTDDSKLLERIHYGLLAQELQDIYPDLVYEGTDGYLSVNYVELIPLLIHSIQSLKDEIDILKGSQKTSKRTTAVSSAQDDKGASSLNKISVSDEAITIAFNIPSSVKNASVIIYDTNGIQVYSKSIRERGHLEFGIKDMALNDGLFVCSLLTDDSVDSRHFYYGK